jgi:glycosyltransferase involved in cell wall biosynthesis
MTDAMFAVTGELRAYHAQQAWISPSRIRVIANGIDTNLFAPRSEMRSSVLDGLNISAKRFVIGSVGRLVPIKDHMTLLEAGALLAERGTDVHVLLAGAGSELDRLRNFVATTNSLQGRVSFVGAATNVAEMLNGMDVFVLPSVSEGMSNTLLEAMASGLPILASKVGGNPEVMGDGYADSFFAPGDVDALAQKLEHLVGNKRIRQELGSMARQRTLKAFSVERMIADYRNLYFEMAAKRGISIRSIA